MCEFFGIMGKKRTGGGIRMEQWQQDNRRDVVMVDIDQLVPKDHLLRKIENLKKSAAWSRNSSALI